MIPIFDPNGELAGWLNGSVILDLENECRAFVNGQAVISYDGIISANFTKDFSETVTEMLSHI